MTFEESIKEKGFVELFVPFSSNENNHGIYCTFSLVDDNTVTISYESTLKYTDLCPIYGIFQPCLGCKFYKLNPSDNKYECSAIVQPISIADAEIVYNTFLHKPTLNLYAKPINSEEWTHLGKIISIDKIQVPQSNYFEILSICVDSLNADVMFNSHSISSFRMMSLGNIASEFNGYVINVENMEDVLCKILLIVLPQKLANVPNGSQNSDTI